MGVKEKTTPPGPQGASSSVHTGPNSERGRIEANHEAQRELFMGPGLGTGRGFRGTVVHPKPPPYSSLMPGILLHPLFWP